MNNGSEGKIEGIKVIKYNVGEINNEDDPSFDFKLEVSLGVPSFMTIGLVGGTEEIVVRGKTKGAIEEVIKRLNFRHDPRLRKLTITGPDGVIEQISN